MHQNFAFAYQVPIDPRHPENGQWSTLVRMRPVIVGYRVSIGTPAHEWLVAAVKRIPLDGEHAAVRGWSGPNPIWHGKLVLRPVTTANAKLFRPPQTVQARPLGSMPGVSRLRSGTRVGRGFSGTRFFVTRRDGFALGCLSGSEGCPMYPLATTDGGKTWRIAGPIVNVPAAQAASDVTQAGVVNARTWFLCCGLNSVVDVTPDAGKHWWEAYLPDEVLNVFAGNDRQARLIALVRPSATDHSRQRLWIYVSSDGRRWRYDPSLKLIY